MHGQAVILSVWLSTLLFGLQVTKMPLSMNFILTSYILKAKRSANPAFRMYDWHMTNPPFSVCFQFSDILNGWKILASRGFALAVETASKVRRTKEMHPKLV